MMRLLLVTACVLALCASASAQLTFLNCLAATEARHVFAQSSRHLWHAVEESLAREPTYREADRLEDLAGQLHHELVTAARLTELAAEVCAP